VLGLERYLHLEMTVSKLARVSGTTLTSPSSTLSQPYAWLNHSWLMQKRLAAGSGRDATSGSRAEAQPDLTIRNKKREKKEEGKKKRKKRESDDCRKQRGLCGCARYDPAYLFPRFLEMSRGTAGQRRRWGKGRMGKGKEGKKGQERLHLLHFLRGRTRRTWNFN